MNRLKDKTTREILAFSLLPFGMSTIYGVMSTALNLYFTDVLGLSLGMIGIVLSATKVWDMQRVGIRVRSRCNNRLAFPVHNSS